jgi:ribonuclease HI
VKTHKRVTVWSDGACSGNPGPGGWGALLVSDGEEREIKGGAPATTNNRMELTAAIAALEAIAPGAAVELYTASQYLRDGITGWLDRWKGNGWRTADRKPVKNADLWRRLDELAATHDMTWRWVRGHADTAGNLRADKLAREGMQPFKRRPGGGG